MMGVQEAPARLFYDFDLDAHVPANHILRQIDRFLDVDIVRAQLRPFYSHLGRPSIDPELIVRMLVIGYVMGIRSERRLCDEVHLNLAYRWFCGLGLDGKVPDHSTFSKYRHGKFRDSDLLRLVFEAVVARCISEGLVGGHGFAVDASLIEADVDRMNSSAQADWDVNASTLKMHRALSGNILRFLMIRRSAQPQRFSRSSRLILIQPASGPQHARDRRSSPIRTTTSSIRTMLLLSMWRRHAQFARLKWAHHKLWLIELKNALASGPIGWSRTQPMDQPSIWRG